MFQKNIQSKLLLSFAAIALIPLLSICFFAYQNSKEALQHQSFEKLATTSELKAQLLNRYFQTKNTNIKMLSHLPVVTASLTDLEVSLKETSLPPSAFIRTEQYATIVKDLNYYLKDAQKEYEYHDILVLDHEGNIVYSCEQENDLGTNIFQGTYSDSPLKKAIENAVDAGDTTFNDFEEYEPYDDKAVAFITTPIFENGVNSAVHGYLAVAINSDDINTIVQDRTGLGKTGESYLLGPDYLMRSDSYHSGHDSFLSTKVHTVGAQDAFSHRGKNTNSDYNEDLIYEDYRGNTVLGQNYYFRELDWVLISEIDVEEAFSPVASLRNIMLWMGGIAIGLVVAFSTITARKISKPILDLSRLARKVSNGDLTEQTNCTTNDEFAILSKDFNSMIQNLSSLASRLKNASLMMSESSSEILASSEQQTVNAREQASAISETSSAALELSKSAEQVYNSIKQVEDVTQHSLIGMAKIKKSVSDTGDIVSSLHQKSQKIGQITELIDDIADQTNLLAVNAAIEAARAGEHGKGFSVVADEIRKLADSTAKSTKDIAELTSIIQNEISNVIETMHESISNVEDEITLAQDSSEKTKEISMSANQQEIASHQIAEAMDTVNESMKQITAGSEQFQNLSKQLSSLASDLMDTAKQFKLPEEE
jgi:methyl-accepting chemotaxis protein